MGGQDLSGRKAGPYLLTSFIGFGSAGNVYRGVDTTSEGSKTLAVKCLRKKDTRKRWLRLVSEVVNHDTVTGCPHVLPLCDIVEEDSHLFLILDMCETDMFKSIWYTKVYWRNDALIRKAFVEVVDGVAACHQRGIFHRDLKPENLMCGADGTGIQIGDFGLATNHLICRDGGCGSPCYMSPESWACDKGDPYFGGLTDIWSLGVILFNMVTNRYPWGAAVPSDEEYNAFVHDEDYLFHTSPISGSMSNLLKRMLHPAPARRLSMAAIRRAVLEVDTFYKWRQQDLRKAVLESAQVRVDPADVPRGKRKHIMAPPSSVQKLISWTKLHHRSSAGC